MLVEGREAQASKGEMGQVSKGETGQVSSGETGQVIAREAAPAGDRAAGAAEEQVAPGPARPEPHSPVGREPASRETPNPQHAYQSAESSAAAPKVIASSEAGEEADLPERRPAAAPPQAKLASSASEEVTADGLAGWRQYVDQSADAPRGVVRRAAQQAAGRAQAEIIREARYTQRNGKSEISLRLHPPELGRMKVAIEMQDGKLDVKIRVEDPQVREAMRLELETLERTLKDAQLDMTRLEVSDYQTGAQQGRQGPLGEREGSVPGEALPGELADDGAAEAGTWTLFTDAGQVDCLI
jgi:flagellar hook-length control protein FliK